VGINWLNIKITKLTLLPCSIRAVLSIAPGRTTPFTLLMELGDPDGVDDLLPEAEEVEPTSADVTETDIKPLGAFAFESNELLFTTYNK